MSAFVEHGLWQVPMKYEYDPTNVTVESMVKTSIWTAKNLNTWPKLPSTLGTVFSSGTQ